MNSSFTGKIRAVAGIIIIVAAIGAGGYFMGAGRYFDHSSDIDIVAELVTTELVAGDNRVIIGLTIGGAMDVVDADVDIEWTSPSGKVSVTPAKYVGAAFEERGAYSTTARLSEAGDWKMLVKARLQRSENGILGAARQSEYDLIVPVYENGRTPAVGTQVPKSDTPLVSATGDASSVCTALPACSMHEHSVAGSLAAHRPMVVFFAAPGQCVSRLCGPMLAIVEAAKREHSAEADFIHVEIRRPGTETPVPAVKEWGIISEPWLFVIDSKGRLVSKFEGPATPQEIEGALKRAAS